MKGYFGALLLLSLTGPANALAQPPLIISGYDDVLRQADNASSVRATFRLLQKDEGFSGMSELYQLISKENSQKDYKEQLRPNRIFVLSGSSTWFQPKVERFLSSLKFPPMQIFLRNWLTEWSILNFKMDRLKYILNGNPTESAILILDNSEASLQFAENVLNSYPSQVVAIYLRQVVNRSLPKGTTGFYSAFDIALNEFKAGRLAASDYEQVAQLILKEAHTAALFPAYAICPNDYEPCFNLKAAEQVLCWDVRNHVRAICLKKD